MKNHKTLTVLAVMLLACAGCNNMSQTSGPQTKSAGEVTSAPATTTQSTPVGEIPDDIDPYALNLNAEAIGNQTVRVSFTLPDEMLTDTDAFRLLLSKNEEPTRENATNWYDLGTAHTNKDWKVNTRGERYVRVCVVRADKCETYSNVVKVDVR